MDLKRSRKFSRRHFLSATAAIGSVSLIVACSPPPTPPTAVPPKAASTVAAQPTAATAQAPAAQAAPAASGGVVVPYLTELWNWQKLDMATATSTYNKQMQGKVQIKVDTAPDGWQTKVVEMARSGNLAWDGMLRVNSVEAYTYYEFGIMQPIDPFIKSSSVAWAKTFQDELLPSVAKMFTLENQLYYLPWDLEVFVRNYMVSQWTKLGGKPAETLDDYEKQMLEYQKMYPDKTPLGMTHATAVHNGDYQMMGQIWSDDLWKEQDGASWPNLEGDGFKNYMQTLKKWFAQKILTDDTWGTTANGAYKWEDPWLKQNVGSLMTDAAWGFAQARKVYGVQAVDAVQIPVLKAGSPSKTFIFGNSASLFKGAKHPQEVADWLLWMIDPTQTKTGAGTFIYGDLNYYHFPVYKSIYSKIVPTNSEWKWIQPMLPMIQASIPIPPETFVTMWRDVMVPWTTKYVHGQIDFNALVDGIETGGKAALAQNTKAVAP